jgi:hypothetical protein
LDLKCFIALVDPIFKFQGLDVFLGLVSLVLLAIVIFQYLKIRQSRQKRGPEPEGRPEVNPDVVRTSVQQRQVREARCHFHNH